jgi:hypothetical protein
MSKNYSEMAIEIIRATHDGDRLSPPHLKLVESAVNGFLNEAGDVAFCELYALATSPGGYVAPWYHGIEHMIQDHEGYVYWKGRQVEHYSFREYDKAEIAAQELARRCRILESRGVEVNTTNAIWKWEEIAA